VRDGRLLLVHRPRYDDWTFPKGKLDPGESFEDAALREVREETGFRCSLGRELPSSRYEAKGRPKLVRYWLMAPQGESPFEPNEETDEIRWVTPDEARTLLTYERDRDVLAAL
jgi:8-oxo-dGTP diphosphatase